VTDLPRVRLTAGSETLEVTGRAALLVFLIATNAEEVNAETVGKLVASFAGGQTKLELRKSLPALRLDRH
jgi:hypothetical protein